MFVIGPEYWFLTHLDSQMRIKSLEISLQSRLRIRVISKQVKGNKDELLLVCY